MALLTINEAMGVLGEKSPGDNNAVSDMISGVTELITKMTNRSLSMRPSAAEISGDVLTLTVPGHRMFPGNKMRLNTERVDSALDGVFTIATGSVTRHAFGIDVSELGVVQADVDSMTILARPVRRETHVARGHRSTFVRHLPLSEVVKLSRSDGNGGWTEVVAGQYQIAGESGGLSLSGEIDHRRAYLGGSKCDPIPAGMLVEYVSGEPYVLWELVDAAKASLGEIEKLTSTSKRCEPALQSKSFDYVSYNRLPAEEARKLFGSALHTIEALRIAAV